MNQKNQTTNNYYPGAPSNQYPSYYPPPINPEYYLAGSQQDDSANGFPPPLYTPPLAAYNQTTPYTSNYSYPTVPQAQINRNSPSNIPSFTQSSSSGSLYPSIPSPSNQQLYPSIYSAPSSNYPDLYYPKLNQTPREDPKTVPQRLGNQVRNDPPPLNTKRALFIGKSDIKSGSLIKVNFLVGSFQIFFLLE